MRTIYEALRVAPDRFSRSEVRRLIRERPKNVGDALAIIIPDFGAAFERIAGFKIPLHRKLFSHLLRRAIAADRMDAATIIGTVFESVRIAQAGKLKKVSLEIILKILLLIAKSGELPGIEKHISISECHTLVFSNFLSNLTYVFQFYSHINGSQK